MAKQTLTNPSPTMRFVLNAESVGLTLEQFFRLCSDNPDLLINPFEHRVYVYRPNHAVEILEEPESVKGDPELPGFELRLTELW